MTAAPGQIGDGDGGGDLLAAEYVLGTLPANLRADAAARIASDPAFARLVRDWHERLQPLSDAVRAAEPSPAVWQSIERTLFAGAEAAPERGSLWSSLAFWRAAAFGALAAAAVAIAWPVFAPRPPAQGALVATLEADQQGARFVALYDPGSARLTMTALASPAPSGRDYELWIIGPGASPVALGVVPGGRTSALTVARNLRAMIARDATFAVTLEPAGGSPSGKPTGDVVAAGKITSL